MSRLSDMTAVVAKVRSLRQTQGTSPEFERVYRQRRLAVGQQLAKDLGLASSGPDWGRKLADHLVGLPDTTALPSATDRKFQELQSWLVSQHPELEDSD